MPTTAHTAGPELLADILAAPADTILRLIYADWLMDNCDPLRGEFIAVQCVLHEEEPGYFLDGNRCEWHERSMNPKIRRALWLLREAVRQDLYTERWIGRIVPLMTWSRGFVDIVRCTLAEWLKHGKEIVASNPVGRVDVTDRKPRESIDSSRKGQYYWRHWDTDVYPYQIKSDCFNLLDGAKEFAGAKYYPSEQAANDALSRAVLKWAGKKT